MKVKRKIAIHCACIKGWKKRGFWKKFIFWRFFYFLRPYNLYCVGADVKLYSINQSILGVNVRGPDTSYRQIDWENNIVKIDVWLNSIRFKSLSSNFWSYNKW